MLPVFTSSEMRECDRIAIEDLGIPGIVLMENAARGAVDAMEREFGPLAGKKILFLCGKGNNGGDGFAMARHCLNRGASVDALCAASLDEIRGDALANLSILRAMHPAGVRRAESIDAIRASLAEKPDIVVDALFGTGLASGVAGFAAEIVSAVNESALPVFAVDIPSGVNGDTGRVETVAFRARATGTMGALKRGHLFGRGRECSGRVTVVDIGMPRATLAEKGRNTALAERSDILPVIPRRPFDAHKFRCGKVFLFAGSRDYTGAAAMASESALRTGAGMVYLGIPESLLHTMSLKLTEVISIPLPETPEGGFSPASVDEAARRTNEATVAVIGPGIARQAETLDAVRELLPRARSPLVIDADALFAIAADVEILRKVEAPCVLTPHAGEFARLVGKKASEIEEDRVEYARHFARSFGLVLVLKGAPTVTASPEGRVVINPTGNPGMASAGMGDVLSGVIAGLIAQGAAPFEAAYAGVYIHGLAADNAALAAGMHGLAATDVQRYIPETMLSLTSPDSLLR